MAIPLLDYPLTSQNARVSNLAGDLHDNGLATIGYGGAGHDSYNSEVDGLIEQAYRQIFFHAMRSDRDVNLESQLRNGNITVRDFDESVAWYGRLFGFELVEESTARDGVRFGVLQSDYAMLCIYEHPELEYVDCAELRKRGLHSICHFALRLPEATQKEWEALARNEKVEFDYGGHVPYQHSDSWYVKDPTGWSIEVDTWYNGEHNDPTSADHVSVHFDGNVNVPTVWAALPEMEDGNWHRMSVDVLGTWITVAIDGTTYIDQDVSQLTSFPAYVGFTAATGGATNYHLIDALEVEEFVCD